MTFQNSSILGKFTEVARAMDDKHEELKAAYQHIERIEAILSECREYFEERADADCDQDGFIPNEEMRRMIEIDEVLS